jgi:aryl-alcohol dehydrogenase-like predicted oxidoreductase
MSATDRPPAFARWRRLWAGFDEWIRNAGLTPVEACLQFVLSFTEVDRVVVGVDTRAQLEDIVAAGRRAPTHAPDDLSVTDPDLINPGRWASLQG